MNGDDEIIQEGEQPGPNDFSQTTAQHAASATQAPRVGVGGPALSLNGSDEIEEGFGPQPSEPTEEGDSEEDDSIA